MASKPAGTAADTPKGGENGSAVKTLVVVGNLVKEQADVLVNTIGTEARLAGGLVSYAMLEEGGESLQEDLTKHHPTGLKVGEIAQTKGGGLHCEKVFHVVLRQWMNVNDEAEQLLYNLVTKCLEWVVEQKFKSIAFPALGCGYHRFPGNRAADIMFRAIETFVNNKPNQTLETVKIVLHPRDELNRKDFEARRDGIEAVHENYLNRTLVIKKNKAFEIHVIVGCLSKLQADVLVNTTQVDLNLAVGAVSRSLLEKGGQILQTESKKQYPEGLPYGGMVQTQGGKLQCKKVFHVVVPPWDEGKNESEKGFQTLVMKCLQEASKQKLESVGFPVLGTGYLRYPVRKSVSLMLETIIQFVEENPERTVKSASIVVAHKDPEVRKVLQCYLEGKEETTGLASTMHAGSQMVPGEMEALAGKLVKYFPLMPDCYRLGSPERQHFKTVAWHFFNSLEKDAVNRHIYEITQVDYVINPSLVGKFGSALEKMSKINAAYAEPELAYHGTEQDNIKNICEKGFFPPDHPDFKTVSDPGWYGKGIYFSTYPRFAMNYMQKSETLLLCKVLRGKVFKCETLQYGKPKSADCHSHADPFGKEIVIFDADCILPCYIVKFDICKRYKKKEDEYDPHEEDDHNIEFQTEMEMHKGEEIPPLK